MLTLPEPRHRRDGNGKNKSINNLQKKKKQKPKREMRRFKCGNGKMHVHKEPVQLTPEPESRTAIEPGISLWPGSRIRRTVQPQFGGMAC